MRDVGPGAGRREEDRHGDRLRELLEEPATERAHAPDAVGEKLGSVEVRCLGDGECVVAVVAVGAPVEVPAVQVDQSLRLGRGLGGGFRVALEGLERNVVLAELPDESPCRLGEAGCVRDRAEVAIRLACHLGGVAAGRHRREGAPTSLDQAVLAEANSELA